MIPPAPNAFFRFLLLSIVLGAILAAGLWPFDFPWRNRVFWLTGRNGILFDGRGMVVGDRPKPVEVPGRISLELVLKSGGAPPYGHGRILSLLDSMGGEVLSLVQWRSSLEMRVSGGRKGDFLQRVVRDALPPDRIRTVEVSMGPAGSTVFLDGVLAQSYPGFTLKPEAGAAFRRILLGDSPSGREPWRGELMGLALFGRPLSASEAAWHHSAWTGSGDFGRLEQDGPLGLFPFREGAGEAAVDLVPGNQPLTIPPVFRPLKATILEIPWDANLFGRPMVKDMILNFLGFVPFGFSLALVMSRWNVPKIPSVFLSLLLGGGVSFSLELLQTWLPSRFPSLLDVMVNTLGTAAGIFLARRFFPGKITPGP